MQKTSQRGVRIVAENTEAEPRFGVEDYGVERRTFWVSPESEINPVRDVLRVRFRNNRVYHSIWQEEPDEKGKPRAIPHTARVEPLEARIPLEETEMEFLVVEFLCHNYFNPAHQD